MIDRLCRVANREFYFLNNNNNIIRRIHTTPILFARDENPPSWITTSFVFFRECFDRYDV